MAAEEFGSSVVALGVPVRYTHSPVECVNMGDVEKLVDLLEGLIIEVDEHKGVESIPRPHLD